jgi:hypothetical protein
VAVHLERLLRSELWVSGPKALEEVERRVTGALEAIRVPVNDREIERQVLNVLEAAERSVKRADLPKTEQQATADAVDHIRLIVGELMPEKRVDEKLVRDAVLGYLEPAQRGRPRRGAVQTSKRATVARLLESLGLLEGVGDSAEATRKRLSRRARK